MFKAILLDQLEKKTIATVTELDEQRLPQSDVTVAVQFSSINYKDGLAVTGKGKIIRDFPMVPGIDFAGKVISSSDNRFKEGQHVVLTGWGVGETHWGGLSEKACVKADWLVPLPEGISAQQSMMIGTAGLTAMLCVQALQEAGIKPEDGEIVVTGASGGVGSVAITLLAQLGYQAVAVSGRASENGEWLKSLGASRVIDRDELNQPAKPLEKQLWAGAIDTTGSTMLAKVLSQISYGGAVAACGLACGFDLPTTVMPFILRGVRLLGVDSVYAPIEKRQRAWKQIGEVLPESFYRQSCKEIALEDVPAAASDIVDGNVSGRLVVKVQ
ncbi:MDR family oxidoreductase [Veronia pacifica]|uniref:acrylyl-CoA reductase (NADPH) n=1 Tax=Veronia pacifica TaxID=1080227 RepID=UPI0036312AF3